ncbi:MAG TPA: hypothetical protein VK436_06820 [Methanocella sp.]|nr:hypothetical protein [Methanocella sp.]
MLDIYCDASFNEGSPCFIGCVIVADGVEIHQSTTRVVPDPGSNLECEMAAIALGMLFAKAFRRAAEPVVVYNDNTEAVKAYLQHEASLHPVEFTPRDNPYQALADRLSRQFPHRLAETHDLCRKRVESFTHDVLLDIGQNRRIVVYLSRDRDRSTNTRTVYQLVVRTVEGVISDSWTFEARSGEVKNIKVAREVSDMLEHAEIDLSDGYFLLTDETWGLRIKGGEAYSIMPCDVPHRIICHEVDRSSENLWRRVSAWSPGEKR